MTSFPVSPAALVAYVESLQPGGGPLDHLADAVAVSARLEEQADALLGHFVERARRSGASWTEIGTSIGVSKQAARKRFLPRWDGSDPIPENAMYARFTKRSRNAVVAGARIARQAGADHTDVAHLAAGLLAEPDGLAAKVIHDAGIGDEQLYRALGLEPAPVTGASGDGIGDVDLTDGAREALRGSLSAALRLGHNFIGTEHLLLGILSAGGPAADQLAGLGLGADAAEHAVTIEIARIQAERQTRG
jgi:Clp amino terminal domain, pathogenicity island component